MRSSPFSTAARSESEQPVTPVGPCAADAVVADLEPQRAFLHGDHDLHAAGAGVPAVPWSDMRIVTWRAVSGDSVQKSHCASLDLSPVSGIGFCVRMKSSNLNPSRTKNVGVLLPARS
jgi:hypothetical protein